jgi:hypothetical protein
MAAATKDDAHVVRYPDHGVAIALLCNLDDIDPELLARSIADPVEGGGLQAGVSSRLDDMTRSRWTFASRTSERFRSVVRMVACTP